MTISALIALAAAAQPLPSSSATGQELLQSCEGKQSFTDLAPPAHVYGNVWYVGTCAVTVLLVTSPEGHVLIDAGMEETATDVVANIRRLGFNPRDIKWIVSSHEHFDHIGGLSTLEKLTGARFAATSEAAKVIRSGKVSPADPQAQEIHGSKPARVDRIIRTGDVISVGPIRLTAFATPGHTEGSTSWHWTSCEGQLCRTMTYVDSVTALPLGTYRFADHPERVAMFRSTFAQVEALECGILLTPHPGASAMFERMSGAQALEDPKACKALAGRARAQLDKAMTK